MKKIIFVFFMVFIIPFQGKCQNHDLIMYSNIKEISLFDGEIKKNWKITPELNPDIYKCYSATQKNKTIKFVSDIDSLEFNLEVNKPIHFIIVYDGDTARVLLDFTDKISNTLTDYEKIYALSLLWSEIKYNFAFYDMLNFNWDSLYQTYIPRVRATTNDFEFYNILKTFVGHLKDSHTGVYFRHASEYTDYIPMTARYFQENLYLVNVRDDLSDIFPVKSKIIEINGMSVEDYMERHIHPYINSRFTPSVQLMSASYLFAADIQDNIITIKYQTPDGRILTNTPPRNGKQKKGNVVGYRNKNWQKPIEIEWENDNIALLRFNTFDDGYGNLISYFDRIKDTLYHAEGIIIDLRQNGGGTTDVAWHLIKHIVKEQYFLNFAWQTRVNDGVRRANGNWIEEYKDYYNLTAYRTMPGDTIYIEDSIKRFDVPIVVLTSNLTCSAAEDFLIILYELENRPLIIGRPTLGSTGSPLIVWGLPENGFARICARRVLFPYSMKPFTEGITPDILVEYSFDEYISGYDKDLEVALKEIEKERQKASMQHD